MRKLWLLLLILICVAHLYAQEPRGRWSMSAILTHYEREKENELHLGDVSYAINPGLEVLYGYKLRAAFSIKTGISYQYVDLISNIETSDRFRFGELSIPFLLNVEDKTGRFSFSTGIYSGKFLNLSWNKELNNRWIPVNTTEREHYSDENFFMDAYWDFAYANSGMFNKNVVKIAPFLRFRIKENWMDYYRTSLFYGVKFCVVFKTKG